MGVGVMDTSYLEPQFLDAHEAFLFKGTYYDKGARKVSMVMAPDSFFKIHKEPTCQKILKKVGLEKYFNLPPWGIDIQRAHDD